MKLLIKLFLRYLNHLLTLVITAVFADPVCKSVFAAVRARDQMWQRELIMVTAGTFARL